MNKFRCVAVGLYRNASLRFRISFCRCTVYRLVHVLSSSISCLLLRSWVFSLLSWQVFSLRTPHSLIWKTLSHFPLSRRLNISWRTENNKKKKNKMQFNRKTKWSGYWVFVASFNISFSLPTRQKLVSVLCVGIAPAAMSPWWLTMFHNVSSV